MLENRELADEAHRRLGWAERSAPALHTPKLIIATSGRGRHDENDLKIAQRLVDLEARVVTLEALDKNKTKWLEALDEFRTNTIEDINELSRAADDDAMPARPLHGEGEFAWRTYALALEKRFQ